MQTIREILNRIRWDPTLSNDEFRIGYLDHQQTHLIEVAFKELVFPQGDHFAFDVIDEEGGVHSIPYHRVKAVYRNDRLIWHREH